VLSVDGGGIRGIIPLHIMEQIEEHVHQRRVQRSQQLQLQPPPRLAITDMFDIVSGTSTGGIIALALTECGMSVSEVKQFYLQKVSSLFNISYVHTLFDLVYNGAKYHSEPIETLMKSVANRPASTKLSRWVTPCSVGPRVSRGVPSSPASSFSSLSSSHKLMRRVVVLCAGVCCDVQCVAGRYA
jgi:hypothetical protein